MLVDVKRHQLCLVDVKRHPAPSMLVDSMRGTSYVSGCTMLVDVKRHQLC